MKTLTKFIFSIPGVAVGTFLILVIPFLAMQFTEQVHWSLLDFVVAGVLIFGTGTAYILVIRYMYNIVYRTAVTVAIGTSFLLLWVNLAVGLVGSGAHFGNLIYLGVLAIVVIGLFFSGFTPSKMGRTMFIASASLVVIACIQLAMNMQSLPGSSIVEIIGVNAFFASLYALSGLLFRRTALEQSK